MVYLNYHKHTQQSKIHVLYMNHNVLKTIKSDLSIHTCTKNFFHSLLQLDVAYLASAYGAAPCILVNVYMHIYYWF